MFQDHRYAASVPIPLPITVAVFPGGITSCSCNLQHLDLLLCLFVRVAGLEVTRVHSSYMWV